MRMIMFFMMIMYWVQFYESPNFTNFRLQNFGLVLGQKLLHRIVIFQLVDMREFKDYQRSPFLRLAGARHKTDTECIN